MSENLAIVTGASSGIGFSLAKELASRGYDLVVCSAGERLPEAADTIRSFGANIIEVTADLSTRDGVDLLWKSVADLGRPVDVACINAGIGVGGQFWETDLKEELTMIDFPEALNSPLRETPPELLLLLRASAALGGELHPETFRPEYSRPSAWKDALLVPRGAAHRRDGRS